MDLTDEERTAIEAAVAAGRVKKLPPAHPDNINGSGRYLSRRRNRSTKQTKKPHPWSIRTR